MSIFTEKLQCPSCSHSQLKINYDRRCCEACGYPTLSGKIETECMVVNGCIEPSFKLDGPVGVIYTSGFLKYMFPLNGKKVRVTIEVIE